MWTGDDIWRGGGQCLSYSSDGKCLVCPECFITVSKVTFQRRKKILIKNKQTKNNNKKTTTQKYTFSPIAQIKENILLPFKCDSYSHCLFSNEPRATNSRHMDWSKSVNWRDLMLVCFFFQKESDWSENISSATHWHTSPCLPNEICINIYASYAYCLWSFNCSQLSDTFVVQIVVVVVFLSKSC